MHTPEPEPPVIREHFRWDGSVTSLPNLTTWARRTRDHYEEVYDVVGTRHTSGQAELYWGRPQTRILIDPGQQITYTEGKGFHLRAELGDDIPRDHPSTIRELSAVLDARLSREYDINAAMQRHPSGKRLGPSGP